MNGGRARPCHWKLGPFVLGWTGAIESCTPRKENSVKHLFAMIAVCGLIAGQVGCAGEEATPAPENTPDLGAPGDLTETPPPDASGSLTGTDDDTSTDDGPEIP